MNIICVVKLSRPASPIQPSLNGSPRWLWSIGGPCPWPPFYCILHPHLHHPHHSKNQPEKETGQPWEWPGRRSCSTRAPRFWDNYPTLLLLLKEGKVQTISWRRKAQGTNAIDCQNLFGTNPAAIQRHQVELLVSWFIFTIIFINIFKLVVVITTWSGL